MHDRHPSNPSAFKLPVNIIGAIKSCISFSTPALLGFLFSLLFLVGLHRFSFLFLTKHKYKYLPQLILIHQYILNCYFQIFLLILEWLYNTLFFLFYFFLGYEVLFFSSYFHFFQCSPDCRCTNFKFFCYEF